MINKRLKHLNTKCQQNESIRNIVYTINYLSLGRLKAKRRVSQKNLYHSSVSLICPLGAKTKEDTSLQCGLRVGSCNMMKWLSEVAHLSKKTYIFVSAHAIYNIFSLIGYATFRTAHNIIWWPSKMTKRCNGQIIYTFVKAFKLYRFIFNFILEF